VPDNGFADGFCLRDFGFKLVFEQVESDEAALELEGEVCAILVLRSGADVVEQAGEVVG